MKKNVTAAELMAKLNADPQFVAMRATKKAEIDKREAELRLAEAPLVEELRRAGYALESVWDFVNTRDSYPEAVPILLDHLQRDYPSRVREGIARALAVREAKPEWGTLRRLYRDETDPGAKDGLAVALAATADAEVIGDVIADAKNVRNGPSRLLLLSALERSRDPRARAALMDLGTDKELAEEIQVILRRVKRRK